jgi:hypothetical protein
MPNYHYLKTPKTTLLIALYSKTEQGDISAEPTNPGGVVFNRSK